MKKKRIKIYVLIIILLLILNIVLNSIFGNTSKIKKEFTEALKENPVYYEDLKDTPLIQEYGECSSKYVSDKKVLTENDYNDIRDNILVKVNDRIKIHGFFSGYIWFTYTKMCYKDGGIIYGSVDIPVTAKIRRIKGKWQIVKINDPA